MSPRGRTCSAPAAAVLAAVAVQAVTVLLHPVMRGAHASWDVGTGRRAVSDAAVAAAPPGFCSFAASYPKQYVAYKLQPGETITMDGRLDEESWERVGFTDPFVDIQGSPPQPQPRFQTRAKMRYDDERLYVAAYLQEPHVWANMTQNNTVIFQDNDFEVFVNPDGTTHYYKETEMNAIDRYWTLCLDKPYLNGGYENSTRVFGNHGWDQPHLHLATYVDGSVNDPLGRPDKFWSAELGFRLDALVYNETDAGSVPPRNGTYWRINFSRVEYKVNVVGGHYEKTGAPCDNWVWSPMGIVDMHLPERWGYLQFSDGEVNTTEAIPDPQWPVRWMMMQLYYAQDAYNKSAGSYTDDVSKLQEIAPAHTLDGTCSAGIPTITLTSAGGFLASVTSYDGSMRASIDDQRLLTVVHVREHEHSGRSGHGNERGAADIITHASTSVGGGSVDDSGAPRLFALDPAVGPAGTLVGMAGQGFLNQTHAGCEFGKAKVPFSYYTGSNRVYCTSPSQQASLGRDGFGQARAQAVQVRCTNDGVHFSAPQVYTYAAAQGMPGRDGTGDVDAVADSGAPQVFALDRDVGLA